MVCSRNSLKTDGCLFWRQIDLVLIDVLFVHGYWHKKTDEISEEEFYEIEYIAERCKKSKTLIIADANFGILGMHCSQKMFEIGKHKFPFSVNVQWNKTRPDRVFKVAKEFKNIAAVGASMQTLNPKVLESIKEKTLQ